MFLFKNGSALHLLVIHGHHPTVCRQRSKRWLLLSTVLLEKVPFLALNLRTSTVSKAFCKLFLFHLTADSLQIISSFFGAGFHTLKAPCRDWRNKSDPKHSSPLLILQIHVLQEIVFMCKQQPAHKSWQNKNNFWNHWPPNLCMRWEWLNLGYDNEVNMHDALCSVWMGSAATVSDLGVIASQTYVITIPFTPGLRTRLDCFSWLKGLWSYSVKGCSEKYEVHAW